MFNNKKCFLFKYFFDQLKSTTTCAITEEALLKEIKKVFMEKIFMTRLPENIHGYTVPFLFIFVKLSYNLPNLTTEKLKLIYLISVLHELIHELFRFFSKNKSFVHTSTPYQTKICKFLKENNNDEVGSLSQPCNEGGIQFEIDVFGRKVEKVFKSTTDFLFLEENLECDINVFTKNYLEKFEQGKKDEAIQKDYGVSFKSTGHIGFCLFEHMRVGRVNKYKN